MELNQSKYDRQLLGIDKWIKNHFVGTLKWVMRFGKTYAGILVIKFLQERMGTNEDTIPFILVPSDATKQLWIRELETNNITQYKVYTINQLRNEFADNDNVIIGGILIVDELQRFTSEQDELYLKRLIFAKRLGLTGTYPHKSTIICDLFPIVDEINEQEAIHNKWISNYIEYNIPLEFVEEDKLKYITLSKYISQVHELYKNVHYLLNTDYTVFKDDRDVIYSCHRGKELKADGRYIHKNVYIESAKIRERVANIMGWHKDLDLSTDYGKQREMYWNPSNIKKLIDKYDIAIRARTDLMANNPIKLQAVIELNRSFNYNIDKVIIFNESIDFADSITDKLNANGPIAVCYHSKIKSRSLINPITGDFYRYTTGDKAGQPKKFGEKLLRRDALEGIASGRYKVIVSVNALNEGFSVDSLNVGINTSGTLNPMQQEQRTARVKTINPFDSNQIVRIYNLYFNDFYHNGELIVCRDKTKLEYRQKTACSVIKNITLLDAIGSNDIVK